MDQEKIREFLKEYPAQLRQAVEKLAEYHPEEDYSEQDAQARAFNVGNRIIGRDSE